mmetsp:Transcript_4055/g.8700  ORF Transcript_4055/g.8700 Transcript_4055/m.8700 type:complete len:117 (-) Transcript_4055:183-533(-)
MRSPCAASRCYPRASAISDVAFGDEEEKTSATSVTDKRGSRTASTTHGLQVKAAKESGDDPELLPSVRTKLVRRFKIKGASADRCIDVLVDACAPLMTRLGEGPSDTTLVASSRVR